MHDWRTHILIKTPETEEQLQLRDSVLSQESLYAIRMLRRRKNHYGDLQMYILRLDF